MEAGIGIVCAGLVPHGAALLGRPPPPFSCAPLFPSFPKICGNWDQQLLRGGRGSFLDMLSVCSSSCPQHPHDGCHWAALLLVVLGSQELPWPELPLSGHGLSASQTPLAPFVLQIPLLVEPALQRCVFSSSGAESEILPSSK